MSTHPMSHIDVDLYPVLRYVITSGHCLLSLPFVVDVSRTAARQGQTMNSAVVHYLSPDSMELARKREELAILQAELTERELFLANLRADLGAFEGRYLRVVGVLYAELDDWKAKIAEFAADSIGTQQARNTATEARAQAEASYAAAHGDAANATEFSPSPELKKLFREVVRMVHPDNALNEADRAVRHRLMTEANLAFRRGDEDSLRRILEEYKNCPESVRGEGIPADLLRVLRQIGQVTKRLTEIEIEVAELIDSEIALLMAKVASATTRGQNLLADMAKDVERRIQLARAEYGAQSSKVRAK
jgi:hypothetical protein